MVRYHDRQTMLRTQYFNKLFQSYNLGFLSFTTSTYKGQQNKSFVILFKFICNKSLIAHYKTNTI